MLAWFIGPWLNKQNHSSDNGQVQGMVWKWLKKQSVSKDKTESPSENLENFYPLYNITGKSGSLEA